MGTGASWGRNIQISVKSRRWRALLRCLLPRGSRMEFELVELEGISIVADESFTRSLYPYLYPGE